MCFKVVKTWGFELCTVLRKEYFFLDSDNSNIDDDNIITNHHIETFDKRLLLFLFLVYRRTRIVGTVRTRRGQENCLPVFVFPKRSTWSTDADVQRPTLPTQVER